MKHAALITENDDPDIVLIINLAEERDLLKKVFNITNLMLREESEAEFEVRYDEYHKIKKIRSKFTETIQVGEFEYSIFLIPHRTKFSS